MTGDCHVRFCERLGVGFPRSTRLFKFINFIMLLCSMIFQGLILYSKQESIGHFQEA
jgi:hypothetical protein